MTETHRIARCPEHGLHGERAECFVCGGPVEQVPMVPASELWRCREALHRIVTPGPNAAGMVRIAEEALRG